MNMPKISIIVPVYKAEKYLNRCVDSILAQTFTDFELLLIDDGSPDRSGEICDEYAKKDSRIRVIHKENGGVSSARQRGLDESIGEYTIHADPDDWVEPTMLEELYNKAKEEDADMVICDFIYEYKTGSFICKQHIDNCDAESILKKMFSQQLPGMCWNKLVRRKCYIDYDIRFPHNIILWEDLYVVCSLLTHPIKCAYLAKALYHYDLVINNNSIVRIPTKKGLYSQIDFVNHFSSYSYPVDWLYESKVSTKMLAYRSGLLKANDIIDLFPEVNNTFIENKCHYGLLQKGLAALLKKNYLASQFYLKMYNIGMYLTELLKGNNAILYIYKKINGR